MFVFKIHKNNEVTNEKFLMAVDCARTSVESVLYDLGATVVVDGDIMSIIVSGITANECEERIIGCFCKKDERFYPEFTRIELLPRKA